MVYRLRWTEEAIRNLENILDYLSLNWPDKVISRFKTSLGRQLSLIQENPKLFPVSMVNPRLRKAVLRKQTTIFYEIQDDQIFIVYLFSNRMNIDQIK